MSVHYAALEDAKMHHARLIYIPFILLLNLHLWNYYLPSCANWRQRPFNNFDLTSSESTFLSHPCSQLPFLTFRGQDNRTLGKVRSIWVGSAQELAHPRDIVTLPTSYLSPAKVSACRDVRRSRNISPRPLTQPCFFPSRIVNKPAPNNHTPLRCSDAAPDGKTSKMMGDRGLLSS